MNQLFIHAYLDEDVNALVARLVKARGYDVTTTGQAGHLGRTDADQLAFATDRGMSIVTHNRCDFEELAAEYFATGRTHAGIIIAVRRMPHDIVRRLISLMDDLTADEMANQVRYI